MRTHSGVHPDRVVESKLVASRNVVSAKHGDATVLLDISAGEYYMLHNVGCRVWELIGDGLPVVAITERIAGEYDKSPDEVAHDVRAFVDDLLNAALVSET
jgi:Coenzyme PQQ synthesis protein D (PqqD)